MKKQLKFKKTKDGINHYEQKPEERVIATLKQNKRLAFTRLSTLTKIHPYQLEKIIDSLQKKGMAVLIVQTAYNKDGAITQVGKQVVWKGIKKKTHKKS
jgi:restriction endonuclease Mrr